MIYGGSKLSCFLSTAEKGKYNVPILMYSNLNCINENNEILSGYQNFENRVRMNLSKYDYFH